MARHDNPIHATGALAELANELRTLRRRSGLTFRQMAEHCDRSIGPLSRAASGQWMPSWKTVEAYVTACGGNPQDWQALFLAAQEEPPGVSGQAGETTADMRDFLDPSRNHRRGAPQFLSPLMVSQVGDLSDHALQVLKVVATAAHKVDDRLLTVVCGLDEISLDGALRECITKGMLRLNRDDDAYSVNHELLREAVCDDLLPRESRRLHRVMAEAIVAVAGSKPADIGAAIELAHRWEGAGNKDDAVGAWVRVGQMTAARQAFHQADSYYANALRLWSEVPDAEARVGQPYERVLAAAADAARWVGRVGEAVQLVQRALAEVDAMSDPRRAGELYERLGCYRWEAGSQEKSVEAYKHALRLLSADGAPAAVDARVRAALAASQLHRGHYAEGYEQAREAARLAEQVHAEAERGRALNISGLALALLGRSEEVESLLQEAKTIAERTERLEDLLLAYANLGIARELIADLQGSVETLKEGLAKADQLGLSDARQTRIMTNNAAATMSLIGQWGNAVRLLEDVLTKQPPVQETLYLRLTLAEMYGAQGRFADAERLLEEVRYQPNFDPRFLGPLYACEAEMYIWRGDPARAEYTVRQGMKAIAGTESKLVRLRLCAVGLRASADRSLSGSDPEGSANRVAVWAGEVKRIRGSGDVLEEIDALNLLCDAELARARGRGTPAVWSAVAQAWDDLGRLYPTAYARWREAEAAAAAGDRDTAWTAAAEAADAADRLGAVPLRAGVTALTDHERLGPGSSPAAQPARTADAFRLTRREREVMRLLIQGHANRQIAEELGIVPGTANLHVHRILDKLRVARRSEAIVLAHRTGLAEDLMDLGDL